MNYLFWINMRAGTLYICLVTETMYMVDEVSQKVFIAMINRGYTIATDCIETYLKWVVDYVEHDSATALSEYNPKGDLTTMTFLENCKRYVGAKHDLDKLQGVLQGITKQPDLIFAETSATSLGKVIQETRDEIYRTLPDASPEDRKEGLAMIEPYLMQTK